MVTNHLTREKSGEKNITVEALGIIEQYLCHFKLNFFKRYLDKKASCKFKETAIERYSVLSSVPNKAWYQNALTFAILNRYYCLSAVSTELFPRVIIEYQTVSNYY